MKGYFDFNATTPLSEAARDAWLKASANHWYNPSSLYREAGFAAMQLDSARERLAALLGCEAGRVIFTSGATESNNALLASIQRPIAISAVEHPSLREAARGWRTSSQVHEIPVNADGVVTVEALAVVIDQHRPALVSVMAANNESGVLQPWQELHQLCREAGIPFHTDAAQWLGKLPAMGLGGCDYLTGSAHKFGGPKGTGFLLLKDEGERLAFLRGGPQEGGRRAGTENYPGIEAMVTALEQAHMTGDPTPRDRFEQCLAEHLPGVRVISEGASRLWNTSLMVMPRHDNLKWLTRLSRRGFAISTGSACSSGKEGSSVVVQALGASPEELRKVVRVSSGAQTRQEDWDALMEAFLAVAADLDSGRRPS